MLTSPAGYSRIHLNMRSTLYGTCEREMFSETQSQKLRATGEVLTSLSCNSLLPEHAILYSSSNGNVYNGQVEESQQFT